MYAIPMPVSTLATMNCMRLYALPMSTVPIIRTAIPKSNVPFPTQILHGKGCADGAHVVELSDGPDHQCRRVAHLRQLILQITPSRTWHLDRSQTAGTRRSIQ